MNKQINSSNFTKKMLKLLAWLLPVIIFTLIYQNIDLQRLLNTIQNADPYYLFLGLCICIFSIFLRVVRWKVLLNCYLNQPISLLGCAIYYWIGISLCVLLPSSMGLDLYRAVVATKKWGQPLRNAIVIVIEKILTLAALAVVVIIFFPMVKQQLHNPEIITLLNASYIILGLTAIITAALLVSKENALLMKLEMRINSLINRIMSKVSSKEQNVKLSFSTFSELFSYPGSTVIIVAISLLVPVFSALANHVFFIAISYPVPFMINLFVTSILFLAMIVPLSVGTVGVREAAYILLYGMFNVPVEIALLVSIFSLSSSIINNAFGAIVFLFQQQYNALTIKV